MEISDETRKWMIVATRRGITNQKRQRKESRKHQKKLEAHLKSLMRGGK